MVGGWIRAGLSDAGFLSGIFLNASRDLSQVHQQWQNQQQFANLAISYRLVCLQTLNKAISSSTEKTLFSDSIVAETIVLALDEVSPRLSGSFGLGSGFRC